MLYRKITSRIVDYFKSDSDNRMQRHGSMYI